MQKKYIILELKIISKNNLNKLEIHSYENGKAIGKLRITALPIKGQANNAIIKFLSEFFDIPKSKVIIKSGLTSKNKRIEVYDADDKKLKEGLQLKLIKL